MRWEAVREQRQLRLSHEGAAVLSLPLDQGGRYRLVAPDVPGIEAVLAALEAAPGVAVLPSDGGLLGAMTMSANLALALSYGVEVDAQARRDWDHTLRLAFKLCGISEERQRTLAREQPMRMERQERWLAGFMLQLMRPPELLVFDRAFTGLSRRQADTVITLASVYHEFHPFRPTLFVDLDAHGLPEIPQCRGTVELGAESTEVQTCPC
ncbi:MAG: hypothetical protein ABL896_14690 [Hylemonella sp.]